MIRVCLVDDQTLVRQGIRSLLALDDGIEVVAEAGAIVLEAHDDGQGADGLVPGNGLRGMRERIQQCGGTLDIQTRRGDGFRLRLSIPATTPVNPALEGALP